MNRFTLAAAAFVMSSTLAVAQSPEDLNKLALVVSIPIYAGNCDIPLDDTTMANIEAEIAGMKDSLGVSDAQVEDISNQLMQQIGTASCEEGSDERNAFEESVSAYSGQ